MKVRSKRGALGVTAMAACLTGLLLLPRESRAINQCGTALPTACVVPAVMPDGTCGVTKKPQGTSCDDGNPCTYADKCNANGQCLGGTTVTCTSTPCISSTCNGTASCAQTPKKNGVSCGANGYVCSNGQCVPPAKY